MTVQSHPNRWVTSTARSKAITSVVVDDAPQLIGDLAKVGFAEVFWADNSPQGGEGRALEETKAWDAPSSHERKSHAKGIEASVNGIFITNATERHICRTAERSRSALKRGVK